MTGQLNLFRPEAEALRELREEYNVLGAAYAALDDRYWALWQEARTREQEVRTLTQERDRHRRDLAAAQRETAFLKLQVDLYRSAAHRLAAAPPAPTLDQTLKHLLTLAHPDKWSQGQPASALAHELAIAINDARAHVEVQP